MQVIKRVCEAEIRHLDFKYFGFNSNKVFTILIHDSEENADYLINIRGKNLQKLIDFVKSGIK